MILGPKKNNLLLILSAIFITSAITAELISNKVFELHIFGLNLPAVVGILPWPVVFLTTDIINEFYGRSVVRRISIITTVMIVFSWVLVYAAMQFHTVLERPTDDEFYNVFGQSKWIVAGSVVAFLISQFVDNWIFWFLRNKTGHRFIWLRSTGSTVVSQLIDSFVVLYIGFYLSGNPPKGHGFFETGFTNYGIKLLLAVLLTPLIYLGHYVIVKYLGDEHAHEQEKNVAEESLHHKVKE